MLNILIVEDDRDLLELLSRTLVRQQYQTLCAGDAETAFGLLEDHTPDLIITDVMMPGMDGFRFIEALRNAKYDQPVLVITAKSDILDKQTGFLSGADDYMVKPVDLQEMLLRVGALLRRARSVSERKLSCGGTTLDYDSWTMDSTAGRQVLPQKEFQLLYKLLSYPGQIFTRQQLLDEIWNGAGDSHTLDVHISRLRDRIRENPDFEIATLRGLGYRAVIR